MEQWEQKGQRSIHIFSCPGHIEDLMDHFRGVFELDGWTAFFPPETAKEQQMLVFRDDHTTCTLQFQGNGNRSLVTFIFSHL